MKALIKLSELEGVKLASIQTRRFVLLNKEQNWRYITLSPSVNLQLNLESDSFLFSEETEDSSNIPIFNVLNNYRKALFGVFKRKARLKGLGYKCELNSRNKINRYLGLKVGKSHSVELAVPDHVKSFNVEKSLVSFDSFDKISSGDFLHQLYIIKPADCYKRKGFEKFNSIVRVKPVNKK